MIEWKKMESEQGFDLRLEIDSDLFWEPLDDEGLTPNQVEAWKRDEWLYVCAEVVASKAGIDLGRACYGALTYGDFTMTDEQDNIIEKKTITINDIEDYVGAELAGEAILNAKSRLTQLMRGMN